MELMARFSDERESDAKQGLRQPTEQDTLGVQTNATQVACLMKDSVAVFQASTRNPVEIASCG